MLDEQSIKNACVRTTAFNKGRQIAARLDLFSNCRCDYEPDYTYLRGCVEGDHWYETYDAHLSFAEESGEVLDYGCTCVGDQTDKPMCKHAAALALAFIQAPERFFGYDPDFACISASSMLQFLDALDEKDDDEFFDEALALSVPNEQCCDFELALSEPDGYYARWSAQLRITNGETSYIVRDIAAMLASYDAGSFFEYGKKLAFINAPSRFSVRAQQVLDFVRRIIYTDPSWNRKAHWDNSSISRNLHLTSFNVCELLELYRGEEVRWSSAKEGLGATRCKRVKQQNPPFSLAFQKRAENTWELLVSPSYVAIDGTVRLALVDEDTIWLTDEQFRKNQNLIVSVLAPASRIGEPLLIAPRDIERFASRVLPDIADGFNCKIPDELRTLIPPTCTFEFYLDAQGGACECEVNVCYGNTKIALFGNAIDDAQQLTGKELQELSRVRNETKEQRITRLLESFFSSQTAYGALRTKTDNEVYLLLHEGVVCLQQRGAVFTTKAFDRLTQFVKPVVSVGASVKSGLLRMNIDTKNIDVAQLGALLSSYKKHKNYHRLPDGMFVNLDEQSLEESGLLSLFETIDELGLSPDKLCSNELRLPAYHAFLLEAGLDDAQKDKSFQTFIEQFNGAAQHSYTLDESMAGILRPYQEEGFRWLSSLSEYGFGGILADEMGLGKSIQMIAYLVSQLSSQTSLQTSLPALPQTSQTSPQTPSPMAYSQALSETFPALIVCPASLVYNWAAEFSKFAPCIEVCVLASGASERRGALAGHRASVYVASYDVVRIDAELFSQQHFFAVILDEAQYIKNHATKTAQAVKMLDAQHRFALTGTPIENRLSELWSIFDFLMPGLLGSYERFKGAYESAIVDGDTNRAARLAAKVGPFILRRLKTDVLQELPDKIETTISVSMSEDQRRLYDALEQKLALELAKHHKADAFPNAVQIFSQLTRLRQICCDPRLAYDDFHLPSTKIQAIVELVHMAQDSEQKTLIFSAFTSFLDLIADELTRQKIAFYTITGKTQKAKRLKLVQDFNENDIPVFLISLKAGGTGLNLTGASVVIHADPWWNAAAQSQATDRAHRIGQTRHVSVYQVVCADSIEQRIVNLQATKQKLAASIVSAQGNTFTGIGKDQLLTLLSDDDLGPLDS